MRKNSLPPLSGEVSPKVTEGLYRKMKNRADDIRPYGKKQGFPEG